MAGLSREHTFPAGRYSIDCKPREVKTRIKSSAEAVHGNLFTQVFNYLIETASSFLLSVSLDHGKDVV